VGAAFAPSARFCFVWFGTLLNEYSKSLSRMQSVFSALSRSLLQDLSVEIMRRDGALKTLCIIGLRACPVRGRVLGAAAPRAAQRLGHPVTPAHARHINQDIRIKTKAAAEHVAAIDKILTGRHADA
jgi:hypothetical protein